MASPAASGSAGVVPSDPVRALQHALYRAAKADPGRRFHALMDKVIRSDVLWRAWVMVRSNNGAPGVAKVTLAQVEEYGVARLLGELAGELREKRYRPLPARRVLIPKPGSAEKRPLSIPAVRDRIVQAAAKIVLDRSSRRISCRAASGSGPGCRRTMPCRYPLRSARGAGGGWPGRTSRPAFLRSRMTS
jgi:RNA-directed DNA polymerase